MIRTIIDAIMEYREQKRKGREVMRYLENLDSMGRFCNDYMHRRCYRRSARWAGVPRKQRRI